MSGFICRSHPRDSPGIPRISTAAFQAYHRDRTAMLLRAANVFVFLPPLGRPLCHHATQRDSFRLPRLIRCFERVGEAADSDELRGRALEEGSVWRQTRRWSGEAADVIVKCTGVAVFRARQFQVLLSRPPAMH